MRLSIVPLVIVVLARSALADSTEAPPGADEQLYHCDHKTGLVALTFKPEVELKDLVTWAMGFTCKNFMYDPSYVQRGKKLTLIAPQRLSPAEAYQVFLVGLSTIGLTAVSKGNVIRIVEQQGARSDSLPIIKQGLPESSEQIVRYVLRPTYAQAATVQQALATMKSVAGDVQVVGTVLLITDYASTVRDMMQVVKLIDVPGGTDGLYTIPVHHADAEKLVKELEGVLAMTAPGATDKGAAPPSPAKLLVDPRTNTLIVAASEAAYQRVKAIVDRIDIAVETESGGSMHVYSLKAAIAEEVAKTLNDAISGQTKAAGPTKPGATDAAPLALEGTAHVIADKATNKLIVMSTGRDFLAIKSIIQELDQPRRQIYIEAMIMEVQLGDQLFLGASAHGALPTDGGSSVLVGGVQTPDLRSTSVSTLASASGLIGGLVGGPLANSTTILGTSIPTYGLLFQALGETSNTNIRSAPSIVALDNEEAKYQVGQNIPYKKGVVPISAANPLVGSTTNIDRTDLNFELDIKPHISSNDTVLLEVKHQSKELGDDIADLGPSWSTRLIETRVVVKDQQTVVIGGLMQEREISTVSKVPLLGDIPVLGHLFKYTHKQKKKANLLILLTPYIIRDQQDLELIRERRVREQDEFIRSVHTLDGMKLNPRVDYHRKRGLVEEINRSIEDVEADAAARAELVAPAVVVPGPVAPRPDDH